jgi:mRNA interferase RelE/StbE
VIEFLTTALVADPHRVGKQLRDDLACVWSTRRGTYRLLYRINDEAHEGVVLRVEHRRDAYRPL